MSLYDYPGEALVGRDLAKAVDEDDEVEFVSSSEGFETPDGEWHSHPPSVRVRVANGTETIIARTDQGYHVEWDEEVRPTEVASIAVRRAVGLAAARKGLVVNKGDDDA